MARASQAKKKLNFDPSELEDLIFSPAVGNGVASHLLQHSPAPFLSSDASIESTVDASLKTLPRASSDSLETTVVPKVKSTVNQFNATTVDPCRPTSLEPLNQQLGHINSTQINKTTVDPQRHSGFQNEDAPSSCLKTTVDPQHGMPFAGLRGSTVVVQNGDYWFTEEGQPVKARQVRRLITAQDAINSYEESVYNALWNARVVWTDSSDPDCRIVQAGYDYICKKTRLAKKSIQRLVARLLDKDFLSIEKPADIYLRTSTVYRVRNYRQVLKIHSERGREYVAKIGIGMAYVRRTKLNASTVGAMHKSTVVSQATVTVDATNRSTVARETTNLDKVKDTNKDTSSLAAAFQRLRPDMIDRGAAELILKNCRNIVPDCTEDEITQLFEEKIPNLLKNKRIENLVGLMIWSVKDWFTPERVNRLRVPNHEEAQITIKEQIQQLEDLLRELPSHYEAPQWRQSLETLRQVDKS